LKKTNIKQVKNGKKCNVVVVTTSELGVKKSMQCLHRRHKQQHGTPTRQQQSDTMILFDCPKENDFCFLSKQKSIVAIGLERNDVAQVAQKGFRD